jgi:muramoyltetrapeptide carboxypeptidase LdcA involved in peptidoglycan recycling
MIKSLIDPPKLKYGDKIAAVTLSWGGPAAYPYRYKIGKKRLEQIWGLNVINTKHVFKSDEWLSKNPKAVAYDLMEAFLNPEIKAIFSTIGGNRAIALVPFIDISIIKNNPKIFLGYSDITVIHFICLKAGLRSFYGPSIMTAFAENVNMHNYTMQGIDQNLFISKQVKSIPSNKEGWTNQFLDWSNRKNQKIKRTLYNNSSWYFIGNVQQIVRGRLIGGCLEVLNSLVDDSMIWPNFLVWKKNILFLEITDSNRGITIIKNFMKSLYRKKILQNLSGILFSKPGGKYVNISHFKVYERILINIFNEYKLPLIPIITRMDFGHTEPMWTLQYGTLVEINPNNKTLNILL